MRKKCSTRSWLQRRPLGELIRPTLDQYYHRISAHLTIFQTLSFLHLHSQQLDSTPSTSNCTLEKSNEFYLDTVSQRNCQKFINLELWDIQQLFSEGIGTCLETNRKKSSEVFITLTLYSIVLKDKMCFLLLFKITMNFL